MRTRFNRKQFRAESPGRWLHIQRLLLFFAALYGAGVLAGMVSYFALPLTMRSSLAQSVHSAAQAVAHFSFSLHAERLDIAQNTLILLLFWLGAQLPSLPLGAPLLYISFFLRAVTVGACVSALIAAFGWRGAGFDLLALIPWNILSAGAFIMACAVGCVHHSKARKAGRDGLTASWWWRFHGLYMSALLLLIGAATAEAHIAGPLARFFTL